jgi:hypothetical protein
MKTNHHMIAAGIIGGCLIIAGVFIGSPWRAPKDSIPTLTVTGIAKESIVSDNVKWSFNITRDVAKRELAKGYSQIAKDEATVRSFLKEHGIEDAQVDILPVSVDQIYGSNGPILDQVTLRQYVTVKSPDVQGIAALANQLDPLFTAGIVISSPQVEYLYSKLDEKQSEVLTKAMENATAIAENLSLKRGKRLGSVVSAVVKSVQLLPPGSSVTPDYATIDTTTVNKELRVIAEVTFRL